MTVDSGRLSYVRLSPHFSEVDLHVAGRMAGKTGQRLAAFDETGDRDGAIATAAMSAADRKAEDWRDYGGGPDNSKFFSLKQIDKSNVSKLRVAWTYPLHGETLFNPIVVARVRLRQGTQHGALIALDAATGKEIWISRRPRRHDAARRELLGKQRRQGSAADLQH